MRAIVSAIVCVRDGLPHLADALRSIEAQDDPELEIVVVDDGSTDGSQRVVADHGLTAIDGPGQGVAAARSVGVAAAAGTLIAFCDQDDLWAAGRLALQRSLLERHAEIDLVIGRVVPFLHPGMAVPDWVPPGFLDVERFAPAVGSMLIRRQAFEAIGAFDPALRLADDLDWLLRAQDAGLTEQRHDDVVLHYRIHDRNQSARRAAVRAEVLGSVRRSIARRRAEVRPRWSNGAAES